MFDHVRSAVFTSRILLLITLLLSGYSLGIVSPAVAGPAAQSTATQIESEAGTWQTWVLDSGSQFRLDAPPDAAASADEITQLKSMSADRDEAAMQQIAYWNAGPPAYRWNQFAVNAMVARGMGNTALRGLSLLHTAIDDATVAAWDTKYAYNRPRPSDFDPSLTTVIPNPSSPSYPSEYAVTAGAASTILSWLFPEDAQRFQEQAQAAINSRLLAGVEYPTDVEAGFELGQQVAQLVIERGNADGSNAEWTGSIPTEAGHWTGENPASPAVGTWQTWVLTSPDQFRPGPPPAYDSAEMAAEMEEIRTFERTPVTNAVAQFWEFGAGGRRGYWFWNEVASRLILEARWDDNPPMAARAYALTNIAGYDSYVACWDAKYTYWAMRPFQIDPEFKPLVTTPNHPSYPAAHACLSSAMTGVLSSLFPVNAEEVTALAKEAGEARIWAGIHFRSDVEAGNELGLNVADAVMKHVMNDDMQ
jgi:membrane-associated phospholipid phosphatase